MNNLYIFFKRNSSTILSVLASLGVVGTTVLAVKATPKALKLIELEKKYPSNEDETLSDSIRCNSITPIEVIKVAWKPYIPSILLGMSTIICIFGSNYINKKNQKSLISAYTLLESSYLRYRQSACSLYGKDADEKINSLRHIKEIADSDTPEMDNSEKNLYFDCQSMRYFRSTPEAISEAEFIFNQHLCTNGYAFLNDLYDLLGLERVDYGYELGWSSSLNDDIYSNDGIKFNIEMTELDDGLECWILDLSTPPLAGIIY